MTCASSAPTVRPAMLPSSDVRKRSAGIGRRAAVLAVLAACQFIPTPAAPFDARVEVIPDVPVVECATSYTECVNDGATLVTCVAGGSSTSQNCPWGCLGSDALVDDPHCGVFTATGSAVTGSDFQGSAGALILVGAAADTDTGVITPLTGSPMAWPGFHLVAVGN